MSQWIRGTASDSEWDEETAAADGYRLRDTMQVAAQQAQQRETNVVNQLQSTIGNLFQTAQSHYQNAEQSLIGSTQSVIDRLRTMGQSGQQFPLTPPPDMFGRTDFGPSADTSVGLPEMPLTTQAADETLDTSGFSPNAPGLVAEGIEGAGVTDWLGQGDPNAPSAFTALGQNLQGVTDIARSVSDQMPPMSTPRLATGALQGMTNMATMMGGSADEIRRTAREGDTSGAIGNVLAGAGTALSPGAMLHGAAREVGIQDAYDVGGVPVPAANLAGLAGDVAMPATALDNVIGALVGKGAKLTKELLSGTAEALNLDPAALVRRAVELGHSVGETVGEAAQDAGTAVAKGIDDLGTAVDSGMPRQGTDRVFDALEGGSIGTRASVDLGAGAAGAGASQVGLDEDTPLGERVARGAAGFVGGVAAAEGVRGAKQLAEHVPPKLRTPAPTPPATTPPPSLVNQTVGEAARRNLKMLDEGPPPLSQATDLDKAISSLGSQFYRHVFATEQPLVEVQKLLEKRMGRKLLPPERADLEMRRFPGVLPAASQRLQEGLLPHIEKLDRKTELLVEDYHSRAGNFEQAANIGRRVEGEELSKPIGRVAGETALPRISTMARQRTKAVSEMAQRVTDAKTKLQDAEVELRQGPPSVNVVTGKQLTPDELTKAREKLKADVARAKAKVHGAEVNHRTAQRLEASGRQRLASVFGRVNVNRATAETNRMQGAAVKGAEAADNRVFSGADGGIRAHPIDEVRADIVATHGQAKADEIFKASEGIAAHVADLRKRMYDNGMIPKDVYDDWEANHPHYIPIEISKYLPEVGGLNVKNGKSILSSTDLSKPRISVEGTTAYRERPLNSLIKMTLGIENQIARQKGAQAFEKLIEADKSLGADAVGLADGFKPLLTRAEAKARGLQPNEYHLDGDYTLGADEVKWSILKDGVAQEYVVKKQFEPLFKLDDTQVNDFVRTAEQLSLAPTLRAGATILNTGFIPTNAIRDALQFFVRSDLRKLAKTGPELARAYWDTSGAGVPGMVAGGMAADDPNSPLPQRYAKVAAGAIGGLVAGKAATKGLERVGLKRNTTDLADMVKAGGGFSSPYYGKSADEIRRHLLKEGTSFLGGRIRDVGGAGKSKIETTNDAFGAIADVFTILTSPIRSAGEAVEQAPRLAAWRLNKGLPEAERVVKTRDITVDFSRGGDAIKFLNRFIPFLNVGVQGLERIATYDLAKGQRLATGMGATAGIAASLAAEAWNRQPEYEEDYRNVPDYLKETGIVIMTPIKLPPKADGTPRGYLPIWIPVPNAFMFLKYITNELVAAKQGDTPETWEKVGAAMQRTMSPVGADTMPLPPVIQTAVDLKNNRDSFRDTPVVSPKYENLPEEMQIDPSRTSAGGRLIAGASSKVPGIVPNPVPKSPIKADYAVKNIGAGVGGQALEGSNAIARVFGFDAPPADKTDTIADTPFIGGVAGRFARTTGGSQQLQDVLTELNKREKQAIKEETDRYKSNPSYQRMSEAQRNEEDRKAANRINAQFDKMRNNAYDLARVGRTADLRKMIAAN